MNRSALLGAATAALVAYGGNRLAVRRPQPETSLWWRTNHAGAPVTLLEGPVAVAAAALGVLLAGTAQQRRGTAAVTLALLGSGAVGAYDDLRGSAQARGFAGHLRALREGRLTTGMVKIGGVGLTAAAAAAVLATDPDRRPSGRVVDVLLDTTLVAATANLVNLLDLRPGRAAKVVGLLGATLALARPHAPGWGPLLGAVAGSLPVDLQGRAMLGDCGANALGAGVATAAAASLPRSARLSALVLVLALNAVSERVSFTAVIERTPWLRRLDALGRPRAGAAGSGTAGP